MDDNGLTYQMGALIVQGRNAFELGAIWAATREVTDEQVRAAADAMPCVWSPRDAEHPNGDDCRDPRSGCLTRARAALTAARQVDTTNREIRRQQMDPNRCVTAACDYPEPHDHGFACGPECPCGEGMQADDKKEKP